MEKLRHTALILLATLLSAVCVGLTLDRVVFLYYFAYVDNADYNSETPTLGLKLGADHGAELPYVFGVVGHWRTKAPEADLRLERTTMSYWTNCIQRLDSNRRDLPPWKPFTLSGDNIMVLDSAVGMRPRPRAAR